MRIFIFLMLFFFSTKLLAQEKKPLTHSVYDDWRSVGERLISNDGNFIVYTVIPQEGDADLVIQNITTKFKKIIARGYAAVITADSKNVICKIKPFFKDTRQAKIKKKKVDEMPKDSIAIIELGKDSILKFARVKSFKIPEKSGDWLAFQFEKTLPDTIKKIMIPDSIKVKIDLMVKLTDSIIHHSIDSIKGNINNQAVINIAQKAASRILKAANDELTPNFVGAQNTDADGEETSNPISNEGTDLIVKNLTAFKERVFKNVNDYLFDKLGKKIVIKCNKNIKANNLKGYVLLYHLQTEKIDTLLNGFNDCKNFAFNEQGTQLAFVAERDSSEKSLQKFYKLWYYSDDQKSTKIIAEKNTVGMRLGFTISENGSLVFSNNEKKLFFNTTSIKPAKDTTLVDFELARLDVWHYNDDYLQPQQLKRLDNELKRSYAAVINLQEDKVVQLGSETAENISIINRGDADFVLATSTNGNRIQTQWTGNEITNAYIINTTDGTKKLVQKNIETSFSASPMGKYIYWYNPVLKNYFTYEVVTEMVRNITQKILVPLYDTENDVPDNPSPAGFTGFTANDEYALINDEYDIWKVSPNGFEAPKNITNNYGRLNATNFSYLKFDAEKRFIEADENILLKTFNKQTKYAGYASIKVDEIAAPQIIINQPFSYQNITKAKNALQFIVQQSSIAQSELYATADLKNFIPLTNLASQQAKYNWLTAELVKWKMLDGKMSQGILYKPENFDPKKKYPVIFYFYERNADGLYNYKAPAPSASTINIPYFVSNGYLVFDPNIYYKTGEPGQSAYNSVVSAAKYLATMPYVDAGNMGIQGQSWGGYQVAFLITKTNMFKAAGAGAPVANMTSAYGGIRWGTGLNRQFQYEKTQSRIGATLWQRQDLFIKNSPLFGADKVNTPLLLMHNDADGSVPWYQGIEFFTALRRLNKKVWMLQYNGEDHNLVERKNRKDLSIRLSQFFDYYLKNAKPAKWIKDGVPATEKGKDWGLGLE
jgi:dipeptidyl aminopeptidase/acylaminoacyl peptidase